MSEIIQKPKKKFSFTTKIVVAFALVVVSYVGFHYWKAKTVHRLKAQVENGKFDNIESDIFDLSGDYKNHDDNAFDDSKFSEITLTELKEGGAEFIYRLLLRNQMQICDLKNELQNLKNEFAKYKAQEKAVKTIFVYIDLRQKFYAGENFSENLKSFETLAALDKTLEEKTVELKPNLAKFLGSKELLKNFNALIPDLIASKNNDPNSSLVKKIRHNLSKLVVIRKLEANPQSVDGIVRIAELYLQNEDFIDALNTLETLDASYKTVAAEFLTQLKAAAEVQKTDQEILHYLRGSI